MLLVIAKASVQNTTQGTSWDRGLVKDLGTSKGMPSPELLADAAPSSCSDPRHSTEHCPVPQRHRDLTQRSTWTGTWTEKAAGQ